MRQENGDSEETMNAGLSIEQRQLLQARLRQLPDTMPPRAVWQRIEEQGRAEGLIGRRALRRSWRWLGGGAVAATLALLAVGVLRGPADVGETPPTAAQLGQQPMLDDIADLNALMLQSRQLEQELRSLPKRPRVVRAGTAATILALEDRIAAIDYRLSHPSARLTRAEAEIYWRERVRLMNLLYNVRYAQVQQAVY